LKQPILQVAQEVQEQPEQFMPGSIGTTRSAGITRTTGTTGTTESTSLETTST